MKTQTPKVIYDEYCRALSAPRLCKYQQICQGDTILICQLYDYQKLLANDYLYIIQDFEVVLRNCINDFYTDKLEDNWLVNLIPPDKKNVFWDIENGCPKYAFAESWFSLQQAQKRFEANYPNAQLTQDKLLASLTLGFWVKLFYKTHYRVLGHNLLEIFKNIDNSKKNRGIILRKLLYIKSTRNRIAHNEPIIFLGDKIDFTLLDKRLDNLMELLELLGVSREIYSNVLHDIDTLKCQIRQLVTV